MTEESKLILRSARCARIIAAISEMHNISLEEAADIYYNSDTATLMRMASLTYIAEVTNTWQRKFGMNIKSNS